MNNSILHQQMREDWNRRAREDPHYYVAFGRHNQTDEEFFATARDEVRGFERELKRMAANANRRAWRALEIGCGPGRLMLPLSRHFGEIHGIDVSDEMVRLARENLCDIPHAHVHHTVTSDLAAFADESFDFVYSYAVFQHIPSRDVVFGYLGEARRVLKPGGLLRCQVNGLPETAARYDTWSGVRLSAAEMALFAKENDFQLLALEGGATQYLWITCRKQPAGWHTGLGERRGKAQAVIRRITNAHSSEPVAPTRGRFASISLWIDDLPPECDLNSLEAFIGSLKGVVSYIGPPESDGLQQVNVYLPAGLETGLQAVEIFWLGRTLCSPTTLRVIPPGPPVPRVVSVSDGIDRLSGARIVTGSVKVVLEEVERVEQLRASVAGQPIVDLDSFCTDPRLPMFEVNFKLPNELAPGCHPLELWLGHRRLGPFLLETVQP